MAKVSPFVDAGVAQKCITKFPNRDDTLLPIIYALTKVSKLWRTCGHPINILEFLFLLLFHQLRFEPKKTTKLYYEGVE